MSDNYRRVPRRIDPEGCGCTDCLTGYSAPLNEATDADVARLAYGLIDNATYYEPEVTITYRVGPREIKLAADPRAEIKFTVAGKLRNGVREEATNE